jgi:hypothetical protein
MPKASKQTASQLQTMEGYEGHFEELDGYTVGFETYTEDVDVAATGVLTGLPDDRCQSRHWGYVLRGKVGFRYAEGEETYEAGDAYYAPPGHTPIFYSGTDVVEFSPTDELNQTIEVAMRNVRAAESGG